MLGKSPHLSSLESQNPQLPKLKSSTAGAKALIGLWAVSLTAFILVALYVARDLLIPLAEPSISSPIASGEV